MNELTTKGLEVSNTVVTPLVTRAEAVLGKIIDPASNTVADTLLVEVKRTVKSVHAILDPFVDGSYQKWKADVAERAQYLEPLDKVEKQLKTEMESYNAAQEELRLAEEKRINDELLAQQEQQRLDIAAKLESQGKTVEAEALINEPIVAPQVVVPKQDVAKGTTFVDEYSAEVIDFRALVKAVANGEAPIQCLCAEERFLNGQARMYKDAFNVPGVRLLKKRSMRRRV